MCSERIPPFLSFVRFSLPSSIMCASSGSSHSVGLHIGGKPAEGSESEQASGGSGGPPTTVVRAPLVGHPLLDGKGKGRISKIR